MQRNLVHCDATFFLFIYCMCQHDLLGNPMKCVIHDRPVIKLTQCNGHTATWSEAAGVSFIVLVIIADWASVIIGNDRQLLIHHVYIMSVSLQLCKFSYINNNSMFFKLVKAISLRDREVHVLQDEVHTCSHFFCFSLEEVSST